MFVFKDLRWEVIVGLVHTRIKLFSSLFKLSFHNVKFRWDSDVKVWNYSSVITLRILQTSTSLKSKDIRDTLSGQCSSYFIELKRCYFCSTPVSEVMVFWFCFNFRFDRACPASNNTQYRIDMAPDIRSGKDGKKNSGRTSNFV